MDGPGRNGCARPIGVFDSGLGGLTVVRQVMDLLPGEDIVYLGDSARVPYGTKSPQLIRQFALQDARFLLRYDPKVIVAGCNTVSAVAMEVLCEAMPVKVVGVVAPAAAQAVRLARGGLIGVIGTRATIRSGAYQDAIRALDQTCRVIATPAYLLVPIVEEGRGSEDPIVLHVLSDYLRQLQRARPRVLILGCTHYPLLKTAISKLMGPDTVLLDTGAAAAEEVAADLRQRGLTNPQPAGALRCFCTDNAETFAELAGRFLGRRVEQVTWVGTDELAAGEAVRT